MLAGVQDILDCHGGVPLRRSFSKSDTAKGLKLLPRRWVVERTLAWLGRCRRLAKDWEKSIQSATAWIYVSSIRMLTRRLAKYQIYE
jgi:putative transposase